MTTNSLVSANADTASVSSWSELLGQPIEHNQRDHLVQFYENENFLCDAVWSAGVRLENSDSVILVATQSHDFTLPRSYPSIKASVMIAHYRKRARNQTNKLPKETR